MEKCLAENRLFSLGPALASLASWLRTIPAACGHIELNRQKDLPYG